MTGILPGDFFGIKGSGVLKCLSSKMTKTPSGTHTDLVHFGVIADKIYNEYGHFVDFETRESISKGPSTLRFFERYIGQEVELFRIPEISMYDATRLIRSISSIGDKGYGYRDFLNVIVDLGRLLLSGKFPPYTADQFKVSANDKYICTEIPAYGARNIDKPIEPPTSPNVWDIPVVYTQAVEEGRLIRYYKGTLTWKLM